MKLKKKLFGGGGGGKQRRIAPSTPTLGLGPLLDVTLGRENDVIFHRNISSENCATKVRQS